MVTLGSTLIRLKYLLTRSLIVTSSNRNKLCKLITPGIFDCQESILLLLTPSTYSYRLEEFDGIELAHRLKKFIDVTCHPHCKLIILTLGSKLDTFSFLKRLDRDLQMKLIEFYSDRANTNVRNAIKRMIEVKERILRGAKPILLETVIALLCAHNNPNVVREYSTLLSSIMYMAKTLLGIELKPLNSSELANTIANFRSITSK